MSHKLFLKKSNILVVGALLLSSSLIISKNYFDVRDKNIGFDDNPTPITECLGNEAIGGATTTIYRNSAVEPSVAVNPQHEHGHEVVATFQEGRISTFGGSLEMGFAHSEDGGKHWKRTIIPFQNCNGGFIDRISDGWVSYGPDGTVYFIGLPFNATLDTNTLNQSGVVAAVSTDNGATWSNPHWLIASSDYLNEQTLAFPYDDKTSITANPNLPGYAHAVWDRFPDVLASHSDALGSFTQNGGTTWAPHFTLYDPFNDATFASINNGIYNNMSVTGNIIVVLPNGNLLNFMSRTYAATGTTSPQFLNDSWPYQFRLFDIAFVRSTDNGITWNTDATVVTPIDGNFTFTGGYTYSGNTITGGVGNQTRTEGSNTFFNVAVNPENGYLYVAYQTGEFTVNQLPQIAVVTSRDGGVTWSAAARVSTTPLDAPNPQAFTPAVAVAENGHVGILYHDFRRDTIPVPTTNPATRTDVWFAEYVEVVNPVGGSTGIGLDFVHELRISENTYIMQNGPVVDGGVMTNGDYNFMVARKDDYHAVYVKTHNGPFDPATTLIDDVMSSTVLLLDDNIRTSPYFSKIDSKE